MTRVIFRHSQDQQQKGNTEKEEEPEDEETHQEPYATKSQLYKYFAGKGPTRMISTFLNDDKNRAHAVILCDLTSPLEDGYVSSQSEMSSGPQESIAWTAERAGGSWFAMIQSIALILQSIRFTKRLRLTQPSRRPPEQVPSWLKPEQAILLAAWEFGVHLMSALLWAFLLHTYRLPHAAACLLMENSRRKEEAVMSLNRMIKTLVAALWRIQYFFYFFSARFFKQGVVDYQVLLAANSTSEAEDMYCRDTENNLFLGKILQDVGWNYQQLPREIMGMVLQGKDQLLHEILWLLYFGPSTTKEICESTFAFLHYKVASTSRRQFMSDWTKYAYCILSPTSAAAGMNQILPDQDDWFVINSKAGRVFRRGAGAYLNIQNTEMPSGVDGLDMKNMAQESAWRKAGVVSDERSIAAVAYLMEEQENQWKHISLHWAGGLIRCFSRFPDL